MHQNCVVTSIGDQFRKSTITRTDCTLFLVQVRLGTGVLRTPSSTQLGFELMA